MRLAANPLYARLARDTHAPSIAVCVRVGVGLAAISLAAGLYDLDRVLNHGAMAGLSGPLAALGWLALLILPTAWTVIVAGMARASTAGGALDLLRLSAVGPAEIVTGFLGAALFRLRVLLTALIGLFPGLVLGSTAGVVYDLMHQVYAVPHFGVPSMQYRPNTLDIVGAGSQIAAVAVGLGVFAVLGALLGVISGLGRTSPVAGGVAVALVLFGTLTAVVTVLAALHAPMSGVGVSGMPDPVAQIAFPPLFCIGPPALMIPAALWLARRRVFRV